MKSAVIVALTAGTVLCAAEGRAQTGWQDRGWLSIDYASQGAPTTFSTSTVFQTNIESGSVSTNYPIRRAPLFDVGGGARIWRNLGVGVSVSYTTQDDDAEVTAKAPHPFFFNQPRTATGSQSVLRQETGVHVQALWMIPATLHLQIGVFGGPSFYMAKQGLVTAVNYSESYPFDTATFTNALTEEQSRNAIGFNAGVDVVYLFGSRIGVGAIARFSRAQATFDLVNGGTAPVDIGGVQLGGGLRLRF